MAKKVASYVSSIDSEIKGVRDSVTKAFSTKLNLTKTIQGASFWAPFPAWYSDKIMKGWEFNGTVPLPKDYGFAKWRKRQVESVVAKVRVLMKNRTLGEFGFMYDEGQGVLQDHKTALKWYTLASKQGKVSAQFKLGLMYLKGQGVPQDYIYAHMWFGIAASSGDKTAIKNRDHVAKQMTPSQLEKAQDLTRECVWKKYKGC